MGKRRRRGSKKKGARGEKNINVQGGRERSRRRGAGREKGKEKQGKSGRKKRQHEERGELCKNKNRMGLVTAMVGTAGLALSLGPLSSHPQEAGPLQARRGVAYESGLRGG